jgi:hypothetical protein
MTVKGSGPQLARLDYMSLEDLWYRNAIIYCLDVERSTWTPRATASAISKA